MNRWTILLLGVIVIISGCVQQSELTGQAISQPQEQETQITCEHKWLDDFSCSGTKVVRTFQLANCTVYWAEYQDCSYGCKNGACLLQPEQPTQQPIQQPSEQPSQQTIPETTNQTQPTESQQPSTEQQPTQTQPTEAEQPPTEEQQPSQAQPQIECRGTFEGTIERIIDGDTLVIEGCATNIRLSLVDTPEYYETGYAEAKSFVENLCSVNSKATIDQDDLQPYDKYERIVAVVYCQNKNLNAELIYNNLGIIDTRFCSTSEFANEDWSKDYGCEIKPTTNETLQNCFSVVNFNYDATGNDNYNLDDEYVTLKNSCDSSIAMTSWSIKDEATHVYTFSTYTFDPQSTLTLYTGTGTDTDSELYWGRTYGAVWNNDGDTLYLRDEIGNLVFVYSYS